jgi:tetratricopeptide (TPR) repeat protein
MAFSSISLPKPKNWQDFETHTRVLFACVLNDPNTQQNGRSGQKQHGVDVYGYRDRRVDCLVGVQCKKKFEAQVTEEELRAEVGKAKNFKPPISEFMLVTTAPRDQKIQEAARNITAELAKTDHPIRVSVWGWEDVEEHASQHEKAWKAFDPTYNPYVERGFEKVELTIERLAKSVDRHRNETRFPSPSQTDVSLDRNDENTPRHGQITAFQRLIDDGHVQGALTQLLKLRKDEWANASQSERYRILVSMASAKLKLGAYDEAGAILLEAYAECPEHKNAQKNRAKGYLLKNDHTEAAKLAREMLANTDTNADAAGTLVQALIADTTCDDPLSEIPEALHETEEVLIARVCFLRSRDNPSWATLAKTAAKKFPENRLLKLFSAEAILDELIRTNRDVIAGGILQNIGSAEFNNAVAELYSHARDAIDKGYALPPSTAQNAALALRLADDLGRAKEILAAAITRYPDDEGLRLQRAIIAYSENDPVGALAALPNKPSNPEAISVVANALATTGQSDEALSLIDETDQSNFPNHVKVGLLTAHIRAYINRGERQLAIDTIAQRIVAEPQNLSLRALQLFTHRMVGDEGGANRAFEETLALVNDQTSLRFRLELSFEARRLGRDDPIVDLLKDRVATDRESEALHALIAASINSRRWVTAGEILAIISKSLQERDWFKRADAILAINTGDAKADEKIGRYLRQCPNDVEMMLARIGIWQRAGRDGDIRSLLQHITLAELDGRPEQRIRIAALIVHYGAAARGLQYGYKVLMDNWNIPQAHLSYHGLIFLNENIGAAMPPANTVTENTVVCLLVEGREQRYRIERDRHAFFEDERLDPEGDLAALLLGKSPGDKFNIQERIGAKPVELRWIKPIYLDAFQRSLEQFNERFPRADGLQRFTFDPDATDPLEEIRAITKARAEADQRILEEYQSKSIPLSFAASLVGKDPLEAWSGLPSVGIQFQVCRGTLPEREEALLMLKKYGRRGCVIDAITLSVVRRLGVEKAVVAVCGPIHTPQSVIDLLAYRTFEAKQNIGKKQGYIGWRDNRLVMEEFSEEVLKKAVEEREKELSWARNAIAISPAMPKQDFSPAIRTIIDMFPPVAFDAAVAANGNELLLLSEDMGLRNWSAATFQIPTTWLQPVLITARNEGHLNADEYCEAVNTLALGGHTYISLDHNCLMHQARKDDFPLTNELSRLLGVVGGPLADLSTNSRVLSAFIDALGQECSDELSVRRIVSEGFLAITKGRQEDQRQIIGLILNQIQRKKILMDEHALGWLIGHSIGLPYVDDLLQMQKQFLATFPLLWKT